METLSETLGKQFMVQFPSSQYEDCLPPECFFDASQSWTEDQHKEVGNFFTRLVMESVEGLGGLILIPSDSEVSDPELSVG